ncbi:FecR domain-containing protein [Stutzerimonas chloritidismutans]|uniref:FecR domain-containing protein n=1 Tax=Stutzerimonas chloritidismutans TaxID=203192 RepID=UPI003F15C88E
MSRDYATLQAAAHWFSVLQADHVSEADRRAWRAWMNVAEHERAWQCVERISAGFVPLARDPFAPDATALLQRRAPSRRQALKALSVLGGGALLALTGGALPWRRWTADQRTLVGEVREWPLSDGTRIWLNTDSAADLSSGGVGTEVRLYRGELLVEAPALTAPLRLHTAEGHLEAVVATQFSVQQQAGQTQLSVFAGQLTVWPGGQGIAHRIVEGRQVSFSADALGLSEPVQTGRQAWARGVLLADNRRLDDFLLELGRYRQGYLGCDPRIAGLRVVGAYPLADTDRVLEALAGTLRLRVNRLLPWWVTLEPLSA